MKTANFFAFFCMLLVASASRGNDVIPLAEIESQVKRFLTQKISSQLPPGDNTDVKVQVRQLDPRLRLRPCANNLTLFLQSSRIQRATSVKVSCAGPAPWSLFVGSTVALEKPVVTLRESLPRNHVLDEDDLILVRKDIYNLRRGYSADLEQWLGQQLKRPLRAGDVLYGYHLQAPEIIKKGDKVTVIAKIGSLAVISNGIALENASEGDQIRVENQRSAKVIFARVTGPNTVEAM